MKLLAILIGFLVVVGMVPLIAPNAEASGGYEVDRVITSQYTDAHTWDWRYFFSNSTEIGTFGTGFMRSVLVVVLVPIALAADGNTAAGLTRVHVEITYDGEPLIDSNRSMSDFGAMIFNSGVYWMGVFSDEMNHQYQVGSYNFTITLMTLAGGNWVVRDV